MELKPSRSFFSDPRESRRDRRLPALLALALALRLGFAFCVIASPERTLTPDSESYLELSRSLASGRGFVVERSLANSSSILVPELFRTPGYPVFLAALGVGSHADRMPALMLLQALLGMLTCLLTYRIAIELGASPGFAGLAAFFLAIDLPSAVQSAFILSETLAIFFLALFLLETLIYVRNERLPSLAAATLSLVIATHVRPMFVWLPLLLVLALSVRLWGRWRSLLAAVATVAMIAGLGIGGWTVRNQIRAGYSGFSSVADYGVLFHASGLEARARGGDPDQIMERYREELRRDQPADLKLLDQDRWLGAMRTKGRGVLREHAGTLPAYLTGNLLKLMLHVDSHSLSQVVTGAGVDLAGRGGGFGGRLAVLADRPWLLASMLLQLGLTALTWIGAGLGIARGWEERWSRIRGSQFLWVLLVIAYGLAAGAHPAAQVRFRIPILPALLPLMALGFQKATRPGAVVAGGRERGGPE